MANYYYTVAALPTIFFGEKAPISEEEFLQFAEDTLKPEHFQIVRKSRLSSVETTGSVFADRILSWEKELRLELAEARMAKLKFTPPEPLPRSDGQDALHEQVKAIMAMDSPLEAECFMDQLRWAFLEDMEASHFFDLEAIIIYFFKLQIALRQEKFQKEPGQQAFAETYETITQGYEKIINL